MTMLLDFVRPFYFLLKNLIGTTTLYRILGIIILFLMNLRLERAFMSIIGGNWVLSR